MYDKKLNITATLYNINLPIQDFALLLFLSNFAKN